MITVSFRQAVIPDHLLGRVNSVYRFFGWGAIPIGALLGGLMVSLLDGPLSRETALRIAVDRGRAGGSIALTLLVRTMTTERLEAARGAGIRCGRPGAPLALTTALSRVDPGASARVFRVFVRRDLPRK